MIKISQNMGYRGPERLDQGGEEQHDAGRVPMDVGKKTRSHDAWFNTRPTPIGSPSPSLPLRHRARRQALTLNGVRPDKHQDKAHQACTVHTRLPRSPLRGSRWRTLRTASTTLRPSPDRHRPSRRRSRATHPRHLFLARTPRLRLHRPRKLSRTEDGPLSSSASLS